MTTPEQLGRLAAVDASDPLARGALEHRLRQTSNHERLHGVIQAKLARTAPRPAPPARHVAPSSPPAHTGKERTRDLSPGEVSWLGSLPEPAEMRAADATALATIAHEIRGEGDRRLVASRLAPVRRYHADLTEARDLERRLHAAPGALSPLAPRSVDRDDAGHWRDLIGAAVYAEHPELTEAEARDRVAPLIDGAVDKIRNNYDPRPDQHRLGEVLRSTGTRSELYPTAHTWGEAS